MQDEDIWCHSYRTYLLGENSMKFSWYLPKDFPARVLDQSDADRLCELVEDSQSQIGWTST